MLIGMDSFSGISIWQLRVLLKCRCLSLAVRCYCSIHEVALDTSGVSTPKFHHLVMLEPLFYHIFRLHHLKIVINMASY